MKLSTRTRYGTRALVELALAPPGCPLSVRRIAQRQDISPKYLEQIMIPLRQAGIVESVRGPNGGYVLGRPPEDIRLVEVYRLLEGSAAPVDCLDSDGSCPMHDVCPSRETWGRIKEAIERVLQSKTLADLARETRRRRRAASGMYHI